MLIRTGDIYINTEMITHFEVQDPELLNVIVYFQGKDNFTIFSFEEDMELFKDFLYNLWDAFGYDWEDQ